MVEFAVVAPGLFLLLLLIVDTGRGLLYYEEMAAGARETARQAVLQYNNRSNLAAPSCSPCQVPGVMPMFRRLAGIGYSAPVFAVSTSSSQAPWYGTYQGATTPGQPGRITLANSTQPNTMYVFIYELDPSTGAANWATCDPCSGVRNGGSQLVVVDVKMRWQPTILYFAGASASLVFDAQTVSREEW